MSIHTASFRLLKEQCAVTLKIKFKEKVFVDKTDNPVPKKFNKTLNSASRGSKQILYLLDGKLRMNRFSAAEELNKLFPDVNIEPLLMIKELKQFWLLLNIS